MQSTKRLHAIGYEKSPTGGVKKTKNPLTNAAQYPMISIMMNMIIESDVCCSLVTSGLRTSFDTVWTAVR